MSDRIDTDATVECWLCGGDACEYGCRRCRMANVGPESHRVCRGCGGSGRRLVPVEEP